MAEMTAIEIPQMTTQTAVIPIKGLSPLIMHKWSEKAKKQMLDNMQGKKKSKELKDPEAEYRAAIYQLDKTRYGFPVVAFKAATVRGGKLMGQVMTELRQLMSFKGEYSTICDQELAEIKGEPHMREDTVRLSRAGSDLRYRPQFDEWEATLVIDFFPNLLSLDSLIALINFGGKTVGVGEWRPEKNGLYGTYEVVPGDIKIIKEQ